MPRSSPPGWPGQRSYPGTARPFHLSRNSLLGRRWRDPTLQSTPDGMLTGGTLPELPYGRLLFVARSSWPPRSASLVSLTFLGREGDKAGNGPKAGTRGGDERGAS